MLSKRQLKWSSIPVLLSLIVIVIIPIANNYGLTSFDLSTNMLRLVFLMIVILSVTLLSERVEKVYKLQILNEKLVKQTKKLEDTNKELESFAYSVSHDLKIPLRTIDGSSRIIFEEYNDKLDDTGLNLLNMVKTNTDRMNMLLDDVLLLSRAGSQELNIMDVDTKEMVNLICSEIYNQNEDRDINFNLSELPVVKGDRLLLKQVFHNIISNSVKFTSKKDFAIIDIDFEDNKDDYVFCISDNGIGFNTEDCYRLFDLFQRMHSNDEYEGTGVGLSIVQRIVRRHDGNVWAKGEPGQGAKFYFSLPKKTDDMK